MNIKYTKSRLSSVLRDALSKAQVIPLQSGWSLTSLPTLSKVEYNKFKVILKILGGEWRCGEHLFCADPTEGINEILRVGKMPKINQLGRYETPLEIADGLLNLIKLPHDWRESGIMGLKDSEDKFRPWRVLDPYAGRGTLVGEIQKYLPNARIDCFEPDPENQEILRANDLNVIGADFLQFTLEQDYDFIVMIPPFEDEAYINYANKAYGLLKPGGQLASVAPIELSLARTSAALNLRNLIADWGDCEPIGTPFPTSQMCVRFQVRVPYSHEIETWCMATPEQPSKRLQATILCLESEPEWYEAISSELTDREAIGQVADEIVLRLAYLKGSFLYWDKVVCELCINYFLGEPYLREN